ncbi:MAG: hypothetical protein J0L67_18405 [Cytophagales bacterium]|jgi:hypothetical protein|nr:hypothetical protein [Cytophagales bacterium]
MSQKDTQTSIFRIRGAALITYLLFTFCLASLSGCKDEDEGPLLRFQTDNKSYSLKDAKLYLKFEGSYEGAVNYTYRDYLISDGDLIESESGWSLDHYTNATYLIAIELAIEQPNLPGTGEFPLHRFWDDVTDGSNLSYFFARFDGNTIDTPATNPAPIIIIKGGAEPDDKMSIQFSGKIAYRSQEGDLTSFDGKLDFTGTVIDKRD